MNESEVDRRLAALLPDPRPITPDPAFADRVVALACYELAVRRLRRSAITRIGRETLALVAVLASFVGLARLAPGQAAGMGDAIAFGSPAMIGLVMLTAWGVATRGSSPAR